ncbi:MAG: hypothetical protein HAW63_01595 [Bdellovibrionaceae bacterium]|nr:hypothetical protein [Pseudobdellovibrionaceae bacterium]
MKKIIFSLLCFSLVSVSYVDSGFAKKHKRSSVFKKKKAARKRAARKRALKYRAYKSFYRRQMRALRNKSNWSVGVFAGSPVGKKADYTIKPFGLSGAYHFNSFVSLEGRAFFGYSNLDIKDFVDDNSKYVVNTGLSFSTLLKVRKSIDRKRHFMPYVVAGYSFIKITENNMCKASDCAEGFLEDPATSKIGLWALGLGIDFFPIKKVSFGLEVLHYLGVKKALSSVKEFDSLNDERLNVKDITTIQLSARYYF